jgi:hypothetical protein
MSLFRSLFRGRPDVFPVRFVRKKTGKPGYGPACSNKWEAELTAAVKRPRPPLPRCFKALKREADSQAD